MKLTPFLSKITVPICLVINMIGFILSQFMIFHPGINKKHPFQLYAYELLFGSSTWTVVIFGLLHTSDTYYNVFWYSGYPFIWKPLGYDFLTMREMVYRKA